MSHDPARNVLRPDNYELFDLIRERLNQRDPVIPIDGLAAWLGVSVDDLCRWVISFSEKGRPKSPYQSPLFSPIAQPRGASVGLWSDTEARRRQRIAQKARDGARATREANG